VKLTDFEEAASRPDHPSDLQKARQFLVAMQTDDYAKITVGHSSSGRVSADTTELKEQLALGGPRSGYGARSPAALQSISKEEFEMAKRYGAQVVDVLPPGWQP